MSFPVKLSNSRNGHTEPRKYKRREIYFDNSSGMELFLALSVRWNFSHMSGVFWATLESGVPLPYTLPFMPLKFHPGLEEPLT